MEEGKHSANVGGYLLDKETNTMPIFVKYAASQYEDEFLSTQEMKYFSKNGRTPQSPEFRWALSGIGPNWDHTHFVRITSYLLRYFSKYSVCAML